MDIGKALRSYTVEPLHDPVRRPPPVPEPAVPEFDPDYAFTGLVDGDHAFASLWSPALFRRLGG